MSEVMEVCETINNLNGNCVKDSFDRFDDNLSEIILSYLSIKQKIIYESVSKKWKRLMFNKQKKLIISLNKEESVDTIDVLFKYFRNKTVIESLFKKFKYVEEVYYENYDISVFDAIIKNCVNLKKIFYYAKYDEKDLIDFGVKFGENLISLNIIGINDKQFEDILRLTPNLRQLFVPKNAKMDALLDLSLPKLQELIFNDSIDLKGFPLFATKYHKQIKKIEINCSYDKKIELFRMISMFENLEELVINVVKSHTTEKLIEEFMRIGVYCKKLKRLRVGFKGIYSEQELKAGFVSFHALEEISITLIHGNMNFGNNFINSLNNCENLKFIDLKIPNFKDKHFNNIDFYFYNLKKFSITERDDDITDETLDSLSKMENLTKVVINSRQITNAGICNFIKKCPQIRELQVYDRLINETTIKAFIERANQNPKIQYKLIAFEDVYGLKKTHSSYITHNFLITK